MTAEGDLSRPLGRCEQGTWLMDRGASMNYVVVSRVRGALDEPTLRGALDALQARHPPLRARVEERGGAHAFCSGDVGPIPLRMVEGTATSWVSAAEDELCEPFPDSGPLLRATFLLEPAEVSPAERVGTVVLTSHHVVGDGMSAVYVMRDLLDAAGRLLEGRAPEAHVVTDTLPLEARLPAHARGVRGLAHLASFLGRSIAEVVRNPSPVRVRRAREVFAHSRRPRIEAVLIDAECAAKLAERCRAEGTTVHGALAAAMLLGILADLPEHKAQRGGTTVSFGNPVNLRPRMEPPVGESLGFHVSMIPFNDRVRADEGLWELARRIRKTVAHGVERHDDFAVARMSPRMVRSFGGHELPARGFIERWETKVRSTSALTNLGRVDLPERFGPLAVESFQVANAPSALGDFMALATSFRGSIFWNFVWPEPAMEVDHARALVADIRARLERGLDD